MATKATIIFNFNKAKEQANALDNIADRLTKLANNDFAGTMQNVSASWKGENANAYLNKGSILQNDIAETAKSLRNIAGEIRTAAKRIYNAEMAALAIAEKRNYHG